MGPPPPIARAPRCIIGRPTIIQERKDKNTKKPSTPLKLNISEPEETTRAEKRERERFTCGHLRYPLGNTHRSRGKRDTVGSRT